MCEADLCGHVGGKEKKKARCFEVYSSSPNSQSHVVPNVNGFLSSGENSQAAKS